MVEQKEKTLPVDLESIKGEIYKKVEESGPIEEIESWRKTFPDLPFEEVDEMFTGKDLDWKNRTREERAFYVAYMRDPQAAVVKYQVEVEYTPLWTKIDDSEVIWYMWMDGCFAGHDLDEAAIRAFIWFADDSEIARKYIEDLDLADLKLLSLSVKVSPL